LRAVAQPDRPLPSPVVRRSIPGSFRCACSVSRPRSAPQKTRCLRLHIQGIASASRLPAVRSMWSLRARQIVGCPVSAELSTAFPRRQPIRARRRRPLPATGKSLVEREIRMYSDWPDCGPPLRALDSGRNPAHAHKVHCPHWLPSWSRLQAGRQGRERRCGFCQ